MLDQARKAKRTLSPTYNRVLNRAHQPIGAKQFVAAFDQARAAGAVRINIGSGNKPVKGWINTDVVRQGGIYLDATVPWPVPNNSVDLVYADNVIEHVTLAQGRELFKYAFLAMKPGAVFRLATPDVEAVARQYLENGDLARLGMERNGELGRPMRYPVELIRQVYVGAKHYLGFCYDYDSISAEMQAVGFTVERLPAGKSSVPDLNGLEVRLHPAEEATSLIVEGRKP